MKRRSGFTLIEMMIVLAIIAALAAVLTPIGLNALRQAQATNTMADVRSVKLALQSYYMVNDSLPSATTSLNPGYLDWDSLNDASKITDFTTDGNQASVTITMNDENGAYALIAMWADNQNPATVTNTNEVDFSFSY